MKWLAVLLFMALLSGCAARQTHLPSTESLSGYGCDVHKIAEEWWLTAWASHKAERDWQLQLSRRTSLSRTLKDCYRYVNALESKTQPKGHK